MSFVRDRKQPHAATDRRHHSSKSPGKGDEALRATREPHELCTQCVDEGALCVPPPGAFVDRLCGKSYPEVAVYMMRNDQLWTHRYVLVEEAHAANAVSGSHPNQPPDERRDAGMTQAA